MQPSARAMMPGIGPNPKAAINNSNITISGIDRSRPIRNRAVLRTQPGARFEEASIAKTIDNKVPNTVPKKAIIMD